MRRDKKKREERPDPPKFVPCLEQDCRQPKYPFRSAPVGFDEHVAHLLAAQVNGGPRYTVIPLEVFEWARAKGEPIAAQRALVEFRPPVEEAA